MSIEKINNNITELEKVEGILSICINNLYDEKSDKINVAYVLEMTNCKNRKHLNTVSRNT